MTIDLPPLSPPVKRSISIEGHQTSVSLEDAFWEGLRAEARLRDLSPTRLIALIDAQRPADVGLATAIRLCVLSWTQSGAD